MWFNSVWKCLWSLSVTLPQITKRLALKLMHRIEIWWWGCLSGKLRADSLTDKVSSLKYKTITNGRIGRSLSRRWEKRDICDKKRLTTWNREQGSSLEGKWRVLLLCVWVNLADSYVGFTEADRRWSGLADRQAAVVFALPLALTGKWEIRRTSRRDLYLKL